MIARSLLNFFRTILDNFNFIESFESDRFGFWKYVPGGTVVCILCFTQLTFCVYKPKSPLYSNPLNDDNSSLAVAAAIPAQKKVCHDSRRLQNDDRSSMANSSPPIGALKAAATPAATPAVVNDRLK